MASKTTGKKGSEKKSAGKKQKDTKAEVVKMQVSVDVIRRLVSKLEEKGI